MRDVRVTAIAFPLGPLGLVLSRLKHVERTPSGYAARCPAHSDSRPSLSISEGRNGGVVIHCFAGCSIDSIVAALHLELRDLAPDSQASPRVPGSSNGFNIVKAYDYLNLDGSLRFQVVRLDPKDFRQRVPDGRTGWSWSMKGVERILYNLPRIKAAIAEDRIVFVVEGEKDADTLTEIGFVATTNPGGAKKWNADYSQTLLRANVVIIPDNDKAGSGHLDVVAPSLHQAARELRVVRVPAPHKDVTDWISAGGTADDLKALVKAAPLWAPTLDEPAAPPPAPPGDQPPASDEEPEHFNLTDIGNAERLIARHGRDLRYVPRWHEWLVWDGRRYKPDETHDVERLAKETVRAFHDSIDAMDLPRKEKEEQRKHALASEGDRKIAYMLARARAEVGVSIRTDALDADPWSLTVENGTIDLHTAQLREHNRDDLVTKLVPIRFDPDARCDLWESFLDRIMGGNQVLISWLQRAVGYSLTGMTSERCFFLLHGIGANGKTTFLEIVRAIAGDYATQTDFTTFLEKKSDGPRNDIARLFGARVVTSSEVGEGKRFAESLVKSLTGAEVITARFLNQEFFEFMPTFKVFLAANHKPVIRGTDEGIWDRVRLIPFGVRIPPEERDPELLAKLRAELPGILAWAVAGCVLWQREGLGIPDEVRAATASYRSESDTLGAFLEEYCELGDTELHMEPANSLYNAYAAWAKEGGEYQLSQTAFGRRLAERGILAEKRGAGASRKVWRIGLRLIARPTITSRTDCGRNDGDGSRGDLLL
jgi:putative DNA primase/helicase